MKIERPKPNENAVKSVMSAAYRLNPQDDSSIGELVDAVINLVRATQDEMLPAVNEALEQHGLI